MLKNYSNSFNKYKALWNQSKNYVFAKTSYSDIKEQEDAIVYSLKIRKFIGAKASEHNYSKGKLEKVFLESLDSCGEPNKIQFAIAKLYQFVLDSESYNENVVLPFIYLKAAENDINKFNLNFSCASSEDLFLSDEKPIISVDYF
jgi:hypothetical protein